MQHFLRCDDMRLARWIMSNPVKNGNGMMTVVCGGAASNWPIVPPDVSKKEAA